MARNGAQALRDLTAQGEFVKGFAVTLSDPALSEMAGLAGYNFVFIDMEHSPLDRQNVLLHVMAAQGAGAAAMVRLPGIDSNRIKAILDLGPDGVIFPFIHDAETARRAVAACTYPDSPYHGVRGQGPIRAAGYGFGDEVAYISDPSAWCLHIMQIESYEGYQNLDEILAVPGVDGVYIGPADLSHSLTAHAAENPPSLEDICVDVYQRVRSAGKWMGAPLGLSRGSVEKAIQMGAHWGVCGIDTSLLAEGMRACLQNFKEEKEDY